VDWEFQTLRGASPFQLPALREGPTVTFRQTEDEEAILGGIPNPEGLETKMTWVCPMKYITKFTF
jgi:hypothetical protein